MFPVLRNVHSGFHTVDIMNCGKLRTSKPTPVLIAQQATDILIHNHLYFYLNASSKLIWNIQTKGSDP